MTTLESLLEGQKDSAIIKKTKKSLSIEILKENLGWIYEKYYKLYEKKYSKEAFEHVMFHISIII